MPSEVQREPAAAYRFDDFTEEGYRALLNKARQGYRFEYFGTSCAEPHVLWRHDVDMSVHRARRLAQIESDAGVRSTFFFLLHSEFYNLLESAVLLKVREIAAFGHEIGLHFAPSFYGTALDAPEIDSRAQAERELLENLLSVRVKACSLHDPDDALIERLRTERLGGMFNTYAASVFEKYRYCSDSNGYWRFDRPDALLDPQHNPRLQVLTHPEWWVPSAMSPYDRVRRCVDGRRKATLADYADSLRLSGRENVGG